MSGKKSPGRPERYVQASLLMALRDKPSYGYELIQRIVEFGFMREAPPGMIYRHLRQMDEEELVKSQWDSEGDGPAKRVYAITPEGLEVLDAWIPHMRHRMQALAAFIKLYEDGAA